MQKRIDTIPATAMKKLTGWEWPGNIRELENFIERAVILTRGKALEVPLGEVHRAPKGPLAGRAALQEREEIACIVRETIGELNKGISTSRSKEEDEKQRQEIVGILRATKGRVGGPDGAAARAGLIRTTLISRMKKLGIDPRQFSS
jgi:transcriptional regulator with GAF, ATPase, and Fis domain